jgi:hypothetical protein
VEHDPRREGESVAEARVRGVLEVRVRVDEAGDDDGVGITRALAEIVGGADGGDPAVFDRDSAALDRRAFDGEHPVSGEDGPHGAGS